MISLSEQANAGCSLGLSMYVIEKRGKSLVSRHERLTGNFAKPNRAILAITQLPGETQEQFFQRVKARCKKHKLIDVKGIHRA